MAMVNAEQVVVDGFVTVLSAQTQEPVTAARGDVDGRPKWIGRLAVSGDRAGTVVVGLDEPAAEKLAQLFGGEGAPEPEVLTEAIRDTLDLVVGSVAQDKSARLTLTLESVGTLEEDVPAGPPTTHILSTTTGVLFAVFCWDKTEEVEQPEPSETASDGPPLPSDGGSPSATDPLSSSRAATVPPETPIDNLEVILDIEMPIAARFGTVEMTLNSVCQLGPGSVVDLGRAPDQPVDLLVNGRLVARGEVVVAAGNYAVRITELLSAADRIMSLSG